jgi:16S rRNA (guanine1207-N2)-methyltransferase
MANADRLALAFETNALEMPESGRILVLRAEPSEFLDLVDAERLHCVQTFRPVYDALIADGIAVAVEAEGPAAMAVVHITRSRPESLGNIARALDLLVPGGTLVVTGAKTDGIDSIARLVRAEIPIDGAYVKAHGRVFWLTRPASLPEAIGAWSDAALPARNADGFLTAPGMFSADGIDPGSRRLAEAFAGRLKGRVADLGAGWGWLAQMALESCPAIDAIDLYEAEALALDAARVNVPDARAGFHWSDVTRLGARSLRYDWVIANPPFHQGRAAEPDLGAAFIAAAARILKPDGRLLMVANRQLPYEAPLSTGFRQSASIAEDPTYKVILAERPAREGAPARR